MENKQDLTSGSILKKICGFMLPILAALVLQAMYGTVDMLIVGQFGTTAGISAVATGSGIVGTITVVITALSVGVTVLTGRYIGEKQTDKIGPLIGSAVLFYFILSLLVTVLLVAFAEPIATVMRAPKEAKELTAQYIRICGFGYLFIVFYNFISAVFRGIGNSRLPLLFVGIACVVNILLDLLFVAVFHMNVAGAAIATVIAQAISVLLSVLIIRKQNLPFRLTKNDFRLNRNVTSFVRIGAPMAVSEAINNFSFLALTSFVNELGLAASSGCGVAFRISEFIMLLPCALLMSMAPFTAQNAGAKNGERAKKGLFCGMAIGSGIGLCIGLVVFLKGDFLAGAFTKDLAVVEKAFEFLRGYAPDAVLLCIQFSLFGFFNGHLKTKFVMLLGIVQTLLVRLPLFYFMTRETVTSLFYAGLAIPITSVFGITCSLIYYLRKKKDFGLK